jgi:ABC-type multidrug transport system fused ATPase/permease subunit
MNSFTELLKKEHMGEFILIVLMIIYLVMGLRTPELIANMVDHVVGKVVIILIVVYLFMHANPIVAVVAALVAFDLMRRSTETTGLGALQAYAPTEEKKMSQFTAFNQFPYTLEQEVVAKMAPIVRSGSSLSAASYKPLVDNLYDASPI